MGAVRKILEEIKWGISPEVLAKKHPWENLASQDPDELLNFARYQHDSQQSYNLLVYLFRVSRDKDLWFSVEVLSQALQHPAMSSEDRNTILRTMRSRLDRIKDEVTARQPSEEKIRRYWLLEASYYAIFGTTMAESGRNEDAVQNFQIAEGIFQQLGLAQQAENYNHKVERLLAGDAKPAPRPEIPAKQPTSSNPPLSASFRGTMELVAAAQHQPAPEPAPVVEEPKAIPPENLPSDPAAELGTPPVPENPAPLSPEAPPVIPTLLEEPAPLSSSVEAQEVLSGNEAALPADPSPTPEDRKTGLPLTGDPPETIIFAEPQQETGILEGNAPFEAMLDSTDYEAEEQKISETLAGKRQEVQRLESEIQDQKEILSEVELEVHMVQARRGLLYREVQSLEKKAAYLKELCDRLERKSQKLEKEA